MTNLSSQTKQTNADLVRLRHVQGLEFCDTLRALLERGIALEQVADVVESRLATGENVTTDELATLIHRTKSASLYHAARDQLFRDNWALVNLYRGKYPDPDIEMTLLDRLYKIAGNDAEPMRRVIVEAMRDVGSEAVLPTLEAILFDHSPSLSAKKVIADLISSVGDVTSEAILSRFEAQSKEAFLRAIAEAVASIKRRGEVPPEAQSDGRRAESSQRESSLRNAHFERERATKYIEDDPITAVMSLRRGAEALGKHLYRHLGREKGGKPAQKMTLEELLKPIRDSHVPEVFKACIQALQPFGNFTAHDQDDEFLYFNTRIARAILVLYEEALRIYEEWLAEDGRSS